MTTLIVLLGSLIIGFVVHILVWRINVPQRQTKALVRVFGVVGLATVSGAAFLQIDYSALTFALGYATFTMAYIISYSAIEAESPTLTIIRMIDESNRRDQPITRHDLSRILNNDTLLRPRVNDLVKSQHVETAHDHLRLTPKGQRFISLFVMYRQLLNLNRLGG